MPEAQGKVVKGISQLLLDLPVDGTFAYKVVFMRRNIEEVLASLSRAAFEVRVVRDPDE